ncbi:hypothetical protein TNCT_307831 [Trichonephila clavata]|uniref:Uncharacterized protein n=1 Tax=Trichonephila clavata TaxID=2740835 RepID=A0A8X6JFP9_TRICU|nr:hypothetical protein TNCT_307831 [Trichonephila clavata]
MLSHPIELGAPSLPSSGCLSIVPVLRAGRLETSRAARFLLSGISLCWICSWPEQIGVKDFGTAAPQWGFGYRAYLHPCCRSPSRSLLLLSLLQTYSQQFWVDPSHNGCVNVAWKWEVLAGAVRPPDW